MAGAISRKRRARNTINLGALQQKDYEEVQRRLAESHYQERLKKGPVSGLSKYQLKLRQRTRQPREEPLIVVKDSNLEAVVPAVNLEEDLLPSRMAHFVFAPFSDAKRVIDGLFPLNYLYLDPDGRGYRSAFAPKVVRSFEKVSTDIALRDYCHKLVTETRVPYGYDLYLDNESREIFLGSKEKPREKGLELIDRFRT